MNWLVLIPCLMLAALPPLDDQQREMLAATPDSNIVYDQPGLYALLSNARSWSADEAANEAGARLPDYSAIADDPLQWRGEACLIEGTLVARTQFFLSRIGYDDVQSWSIRTPATSPGGGGIIVVFLTNPPAVQWGLTIEKNTAPLTQNMKVRLVARFYTVYHTADRNDEHKRNYPMFVGRSVTFPDQAAGSSELGLRPMLLMTLIFVMIVGYVIVIIVRIKRHREARRARVDDEDAPRRRHPQSSNRDDLPEDPADAMAALENEHEEKQD